MAGISRGERIGLGSVALFTLLAAVARYGHWSALLAFGLATFALGGLAYIVAFSTEQVGERFGPAITGVLQSTLGNLPELFIVIFALRAGQTVVAQTSIVGSLLANGLLVLGFVLVAGARESRDGLMRFNARLPNDTTTLLLVTTFIISIVALSQASHDPASDNVRSISIVAAVVLLLVYLAWLVPYLRNAGESEQTHGSPRIAFPVAIGLLALGGVGSAFVSDWFIHALLPAIHKLGVGQAFAGLVIVAIAGNAVEHATGIVLARKGQSDLAISVVKNSVSQIAAFLFPVLVLISLLFVHSLTFALAPVYVGALALTVISMWQITGKGEAAAFEGWALVAIYVVVAAVTLYE